jgi:hypothetical protein
MRRLLIVQTSPQSRKPVWRSVKTPSLLPGIAARPVAKEGEGAAPVNACNPLGLNMNRQNLPETEWKGFSVKSASVEVGLAALRVCARRPNVD